MSQWHGGKGSRRRDPQDKMKFDENWDRIFGKKEPIVDEDGTVHDMCGTPDCCGKCATAGEHLHDSDNSLKSNENKVPQLKQQVIEI